MNVIGGLRIDEPACDIAAALALVSSLTDRVIPDDLIAFGELGLSGECRAVSNLDVRLREAERLGFRKAVIPFRNAEKYKTAAGIRLIPVRSVYEALKILKPAENNT